MIKAGSSIVNMSVDDVFYQDFKSYKIGNATLGISQVITLDFENMQESLPLYVDKLNNLAKGDYEVVTLFITDIMKNGSYVLYNTSAKEIVEESYNINDLTEGYFIANLVSRKKQMLPSLMDTLEKRS